MIPGEYHSQGERKPQQVHAKHTQHRPGRLADTWLRLLQWCGTSLDNEQVMK